MRYTTEASTLPTKYTYTGQYSYVSDEATDLGSLGFGLMYYGARWYDVALGRFVQADTIIPSPGDSQSWDRFAYTLNNPLKYTDPSGHDVCDEDGNYCYGQNGKYRGVRTGPSYSDLILYKNNELAELVKEGELTDLQALAQLINYSASLTPGCTACFVSNLGSVLTGQSSGNYAINEINIFLGLGEHDPQYRVAEKLGQSGYAKIFQDPASAVAAGGGNQARHFWFYVQVGFESGSTIGNTGVVLHETILTNNTAGNSLQDTYLGYEGVKLGVQLANGSLGMKDVSNYVLNTLSPNSEAAQYYETFYNYKPSTPLVPYIP